MTAFLGVLYLLVFLAAGCTCVRFLLPQKSLLTRVWLGVSLGLLLMMWLPALIAFAVDFTWTAHLLALIPLALGGDLPGNEIQSPMAKVILGGLLSSTLLNGFIVPAVYLIINRKNSNV
mgnify:CR=1 FL=1